MGLPVLKYITVEEYLELEDATTEKHEYYEGEIFAMAGAGYNHNLIVRNALSAIDVYLRGKSCHIFPSDLKVHIEDNTLFTYPDLSIICGPPQFWNGRTDVVTNPACIIEVLSKSTHQYDRLSKFPLYRDIPSLKEYIMICSWEMRVDRYVRQSEREWNLTGYRLPDELLTLTSIGLSLPVSEFYRDVNFSLSAEASK